MCSEFFEIVSVALDLEDLADIVLLSLQGVIITLVDQVTFID